MIKWFKRLSGTEKGMFIFIILLVIGIIMRWGYVSSQVAGAWKDRFTPDSGQQAVPNDTIPAVERQAE